jgi:hypothetical protein
MTIDLWAGFGRGGEEKKPFPCWESNPGRPAKSSLYRLHYRVKY